MSGHHPSVTPVTDTLIDGRQVDWSGLSDAAVSKRTVFQIHAGNITLVLSFSLYHLFEPGNPTKKIFLWLGNASGHHGAGGRIRHDSGLRSRHRTSCAIKT
jgi:hypothetical protein